MKKMMMRRLTVVFGVTVAAACQRPAAAPPRAGHYLYVTDTEQEEVTGYRLNEDTGALTQLAERPYLTGHSGVRRLAIGPDGTFGFLGTAVESISFTVGEDGGLAERKGGALPGSTPTTAVHPSGRFLYISGVLGIELRTIAKDGVPGKDPIAGYSVRASDMSIDAPGRQLFAFNSQDSLLYVFDIDAATGRLTPAPHSPFRAEDQRTKAARMHPNGLLLFALAERSSGSRMHVFLRNADGFGAVIGSPFPLRADAQSFTFSPDGRYLFVVHKKSHLIAAYAVDDAGGIHPVAGSPFTARPDPELIEADPGGKFLYVTYPAAGTVGLFSIAPDTGALTQVPGSTTRVSLHPRVTVSVVPPVVVDVASLASPESQSLQPIDAVAPADPGGAAAPAGAASELARTEPKAAPAPAPASSSPEATQMPAFLRSTREGLKLSCDVPATHGRLLSAQGTIVSNLERIPLMVTEDGDRSLRAPGLSAKPSGVRYGDTVEVEFAPVPNTKQPPQPVPIKLRTIDTPEDTDATITHLSLLVEIPPAEDYIKKSVDDYITEMLAVKHLTLPNRSGVAALLRSEFVENPVGTYDIYCTFHLQAAPLEKNLVARTRVQVVSKGKHFDNYEWTLTR